MLANPAHSIIIGFQCLFVCFVFNSSSDLPDKGMLKIDFKKGFLKNNSKSRSMHTAFCVL